MKNLLKIAIIIVMPFLIGLSMPDDNQTNLEWDGSELNPEHLDGRFTGGFGEETCRSCHFDYDLNMESGSLIVQGLSNSYEPGKTYDIIISLTAEQLEVGGFQMTSRFEDGSQAGEFNWDGDQLMFTPSISDDVQYLQHSAAGIRPTEDREIHWVFSWTAPSAKKTILINLAANSGNDDDSAFGDWIYAKELKLKPK